MKLGVTADVHLTAAHPEREAALSAIMEICKQENFDYLLIAGDLFDESVDLEEIKPRIRDIFSENSIQTFVIPGNHDQTAYRTEDYFGRNIEVLTTQPYAHRELDGATLIGVPYFDGDFRSITPSIAQELNPHEPTILLLHCTLAGHRDGFGTESSYLPVAPETLLELPVDYVCAGHIHSAPTYHEFEDMVFVYPGSPVPITRSETGRRGIWIIDTETESVTQRKLPTRYYQPIEIAVRPGDTETAINELEDRLNSMELDTAHVIVTPTGFIADDERAFFDQLEDTLTAAGPLDYEVDESQVSSATTVLESDLYQAFHDRLNDQEETDVQAVERLALTAFSRVYRRTGQ